MTLGGTTVKGSVTGSGGAVMVNSEIEGNVGFNNEVTLTNTIVAGFVESASREITLSGGSVGGGVNSSGGAGVFIDGTTVQGDISSANIISIEDSKVTGNVGSSCCKVTVTSSSVQGNIFTQGNPIELNGTDVVGTVSNTNKIYLNSSFVYGDVLAATGWGSQVTIQGTGNSRIYGQCAYSGVSPTYLCSDSKDINELLPLYLRFDEATWRNATVRNSGTLDMVGSASGAAETAGATPALSGPWGTCRYGKFSGTGLVSVPHSAALSFSNELSASFWLNVSELPTSGSVALLDKGDNYRLELDSSGRLVLRVNTRSRELVISTVVGEGWNHVGFNLEYRSFIFILPTVKANIYINGKLKVSGSDTGIIGLGPIINNESLYIGGDGSNSLRGFIDEVRLDDVLWGATEFGRQARARHWCGDTSKIDHFEIQYQTDSPLTCSPLPVTIKACLNEACSQLYTDPVTINLAPSTGWVGGMPRTFSGGQAIFNLQVTTPGNIDLGIFDSTPSADPSTPIACSSNGCRVTFYDSGFIFTVPHQVANKQSETIVLRALKIDDQRQKCVPSFVDVTHPVSLWSDYEEPKPEVVRGAPRIALRYNALAGDPENISSNVIAPTNIPLKFDKHGEAKLWLRYPDSGRLRLNALHVSDTAYAIGSASFVVTPYGLCLQTAAKCISASADCVVFPGGVRAGDNFSLSIRAVGWQSDGEALTAETLCNNPTTPNFHHENIALRSDVKAPLPGVDGNVMPGAYFHELGDTSTVNVSISEVGVFTITATPGNYLGVPMSGGTSDLVGRFLPAYLDVEGSASLKPACGSAFSYQRQWMEFATGKEPTLTVTAYNRAGDVTLNYDRPDFWQLQTPQSPPYVSFSSPAELALYAPDSNWPAELAARNSRLRFEGSLEPSVIGADDGDGSRTYRWLAHKVMYEAAIQPTRADLPFNASLRQLFSKSQLSEGEGSSKVCYGSGNGCQAFSYDFAQEPGSEVRLGRLTLGNAHGSELQGLSLPLRIETWRDGNFQVETQDACSAPLLGDPATVADTFSGNLSAGETNPSLSGLTAGIGQILMSAPGVDNYGSVQVELPGLPAWLLYDWNSAGRQAARGLATFGIYKGPKPLIFRREVYR
ncbi:LamG domain-containing protein [Stutzerimonas zhaodongensis]|uniref:DUF6701 domain-containing protein n=1 Tax=Stutzerimonas zhaodongensis TaxID=1176257 RepID=A0ABX8IUN7_9GAMM|nr:LamG domain-containing protein [Stutzerimonas zhaodongensis]QWV16454.1 hypothetical protein KQ248_18450 [Stutzerimonas zhaodongensis]